VLFPAVRVIAGVSGSIWWPEGVTADKLIEKDEFGFYFNEKQTVTAEFKHYLFLLAQRSIVLVSQEQKCIKFTGITKYK